MTKNTYVELKIQLQIIHL